MAIPTISSVSPSTIWTGGQLVIVTGTNFRLPPEPGASPSGPLPAPTPTVSVAVGGVAATLVEVLSATKLACKLPAADPSPLVAGSAVGSDLVVRNLDDDGDPITGESATSTRAIVYARPDLSVEDDGGRIERALLHLLRRQIIDNVVKIGSGVDYGDATVTELSDPPGLLLIGPRVRPEGQHWHPQRGAVSSPSIAGTGVDIRRPPETVALEYTISAYTESGAQNTSLMFLVRKVIKENATLEVARDPSDATKGTISYQVIVPMEAEGRDNSVPNKDGVHSSDCVTLVIHGVSLEDIASFPGQAIEQVAVGTQESEVVDMAART